MKMSISAKLGLGFATVIALMAISAGVAYYNVRNMQTCMNAMLDNIMPTVRSCDRLSGAVRSSVASLRGYMVLGDDEQSAEVSRANYDEAWQEIDARIQRLDDLSLEWNDPDALSLLEKVNADLNMLRDAQTEIWDIAFSDENSPGMHILSAQLAPRCEQLIESLTQIIALEDNEAASEERQELLLSLAELRANLSMSLASLRAYVLSAETEDKTEFQSFWKKQDQSLQEVNAQSALFTPQQQELWNSFQVTYSEFSPLPEQIVAMRHTDDWNRADTLMENVATPISRQLSKNLDTLSDFAVARRNEQRAVLDSASRSVLIALLGATLAGIVIASAVAVVLSRKIVRTVRALADRAEQIARGDLTGSAIVTGSKDELGQLADGFNTMISGLKELSSQVHSVTENVNSAATQISSSAKQQAGSTREQVATVQEINSTMQEISRSGAQIIEKAKQVAAAAESASASSKSGIEAVQTMNRTTEAIRDQVEQVAENIVALSEKTQAVGEIISTVNEIAEQSNLLALNATIEAAEAGSEGSRFSVVAAEMKNLADQAKECTVQVRKILSDIQKGINTSVMLTEEAVKRVESGKQQADISESAIRQMSDTTEESVLAFQQIIAATNQQQVGFEQVTKGMSDIDVATQQTASGTAQLEQAVASLSSLSGQLKSAVAAYQV